uniref:CDT1 domain-containing protein n=1 Tax=Rhabditophanes sp. KR3021 TaxID=114890 RepID=A0AC35TLE7_9BILA
MPTFKPSPSLNITEEDANESFFSTAGTPTAMLSVTNLFGKKDRQVASSVNTTPAAKKGELHTSIFDRVEIKTEVSPDSDQENEPSMGKPIKLIPFVGFGRNSTTIGKPKSFCAMEKAANFIKNEKLNEKVVKAESVALSRTPSIVTNPLYVLDILGSAFELGTVQIEQLCHQFEKDVQLLREKEELPINKWDAGKHNLSDTILKCKERITIEVATPLSREPTKPLIKEMSEEEIEREEARERLILQKLVLLSRIEEPL